MGSHIDCKYLIVRTGDESNSYYCVKRADNIDLDYVDEEINCSGFESIIRKSKLCAHVKS